MSDPAILKVRVISPDKVVYEGEAKHVFAPGTSMTLGILPGHTPLFAELVEGKVEVVPTSGEPLIFETKSGLLRVKSDEVTILMGI